MSADPSLHDLQQVTAPSTVVPRLPLGGVGPQSPSKRRRPIQFLMPLKDIPDIANGFARDQRPMLEEEVITSEIDERAPCDSATTAASGASSGGAQWHDQERISWARI